MRYLFIHYDNLISDDAFKEGSVNIPLIQYIKQAIAEDFQIKIITYNYDIWLERLLRINNLDFSISAFDDIKKKIEIFKQHGSISFSFKTKLSDSVPYKIKFTTDDIAQEIKNFDLLYEFSNDYPLVNSIIPPAVDSNRSPYDWISEIRKT